LWYPEKPIVTGAFSASSLHSLIDLLARAGVPAEIVSMPLAGATAPVTLVGSVVQHAAECISGITIRQLAQPGSPIVWGGMPENLFLEKSHSLDQRDSSRDGSIP
jgi:trimethylamine--corrinoid protein Co-methyltransferase